MAQTAIINYYLQRCCKCRKIVAHAQYKKRCMCLKCGRIDRSSAPNLGFADGSTVGSVTGSATSSAKLISSLTAVQDLTKNNPWRYMILKNIYPCIVNYENRHGKALYKLDDKEIINKVLRREINLKHTK